MYYIVLDLYLLYEGLFVLIFLIFIFDGKKFEGRIVYSELFFFIVRMVVFLKMFFFEIGGNLYVCNICF